MKNKFSIMLIAVIFLFPIIAKAQVYSPPMIYGPTWSQTIWNGNAMRQLGINAVGQQVRNNQRLNEINKNGKLGKNAKNNQGVSNNSNGGSLFPHQLSFIPRASWIIAEKVTEGKPNAAAEKQQLENLFYALQDIYFNSFESENKELGMPYSDVATTMVFYIGMSYMISNEIDSIDTKNSLAIYKQISAVLLQNPQFLALSNEDKKLLAEVFIISGAMPAAIETKDKLAAKKAAKENLERIFGDNANKLKITERGIEF